jgi:hypothetical protein
MLGFMAKTQAIAGFCLLVTTLLELCAFKKLKRYVIALKNKIPQATVTGKWWKNINNVVYLENCTVEGL